MARHPGTGQVAAVPVRAWATAGVVAFGLAVLSALATPLMGLPDEPAHAVHAVAVAHGEVAGDDRVETDPGSGWTRTETTVEVPAAYAALPTLPTCFAFEPTVPATCAPSMSATAGPTTSATSTVGTYAPAWYAAVGWPARLLPPTAALYGMRVVAATLFGLLVGIAVVGVLRAGAGRWGVLGVALALPPVAVHLAGGINPSGTEIAGGVALWSTTAALVRGGREVARGDLVRWAVAGVVVAVTRPLGPVVALGIPVMTVLVLGAPAVAPWRRRPGAVWAAGLVVAAGAASLAWSLWRGTLSSFSGFPAPEATGLVAVRRSLALVPERLVEMVGVLGWADVGLPDLLVLGWLALVGALVVAGLWSGDRRAGAWLVVLAVVVLVLPIAADVRSAPTIGFVWQGRYTLPVAAGLPVLAGVLVGRHRPVVGRAWWPAGTVGLLGIAHLVALLAVLRRFRVGVDGDVLSALGEPGVHLGLAGGVLVAVAVPVVVAPAVTLWNGQCAAPGEVADRR